MSKGEKLSKQIHEANVAVHRIEASYYEQFHPEVYSRQEQKRIIACLSKLDKLVTDNQKRALDFGAGTGNLTGKLLALGYKVTAVDISAEMCNALKRKFMKQVQNRALTVVNAPIEEANFEPGEFDLVTCYSVLHHLPDYESALMRLSSFLKSGGGLYLDHEASPYYWQPEPTLLAELVKSIYLHANPILNSFYFRLVGLKVPVVDYSLSDYWFKKEHALDHQKIQLILKRERFEWLKRSDYHLKGSWIVNPISGIYRLICRPEMSCWIAKK